MNPCIQCGACCSTFRVSFYWAESDPFLGGTVPEALTEKVSPSCVSMKGTNQPLPRCVALVGNIGEDIRCNIYEQRSTTCREFEAGSVACIKARVKHGLPVDIIPVVAA